MISKVQINNFKSFGNEVTELELSPLTIILGQNGAGKSAVLEAIGLLAQTAALGRHHGQATFAWRGAFVDFGETGEAAVHEKDKSAPTRRRSGGTTSGRMRSGEPWKASSSRVWKSP